MTYYDKLNNILNNIENNKKNIDGNIIFWNNYELYSGLSISKILYYHKEISKYCNWIIQNIHYIEACMRQLNIENTLLKDKTYSICRYLDEVLEILENTKDKIYTKYIEINNTKNDNKLFEF